MSFHSEDEHLQDPKDSLSNKKSPVGNQDSGSVMTSKHEETKNTKFMDNKKLNLEFRSPRDQIDFNKIQGSYSDRPSHHYNPPFNSNTEQINRFRNTSRQSFMSIALDFTNKTLLKTNENKQYYLVNWDSRSLQISENEIIITGGSEKNASFLLNVEKQSLDKLANVNIGRKLHAMAWIDTFPAVIGGLVENMGAVGYVEVLKNNQWVQVSPLLCNRYGHAATFHDNKTWVVGGAKNNQEGEENIEVYEKNNWSVIKIQATICRVGIGLFGLDNNLYILGGFTLNKQNSSEVLIFNITSETCHSGNNLTEPSCFSQNMWQLSHSTIQTHALGGKKIIYQINP